MLYWSSQVDCIRIRMAAQFCKGWQRPRRENRLTACSSHCTYAWKCQTADVTSMVKYSLTGIHNIVNKRITVHLLQESSVVTIKSQTKVSCTEIYFCILQTSVFWNTELPRLFGFQEKNTKHKAYTTAVLFRERINYIQGGEKGQYLKAKTVRLTVNSIITPTRMKLIWHKRTKYRNM